MFTRTVMDLCCYSIGSVCGRLHLFHALLPSRRHIKTNVWILLIVSPILSLLLQLESGSFVSDFFPIFTARRVSF